MNKQDVLDAVTFGVLGCLAFVFILVITFATIFFISFLFGRGESESQCLIEIKTAHVTNQVMGTLEHRNGIAVCKSGP